MDEFIRKIPDNMYIFEITKLCGYGMFVVVYKNATISELFKVVSNIFGNVNVEHLFFRNEETKEKHIIPKTDFFTMKELIAKFRDSPSLKNAVKPVYDLPSPVVYRVYYDDGHAQTGCCSK
jgi:hypothetical protein